MCLNHRHLVDFCFKSNVEYLKNLLEELIKIIINLWEKFIHNNAIGEKDESK